MTSYQHQNRSGAVYTTTQGVSDTDRHKGRIKRIRDI